MLDDLKKYERKVYSQLGQDGILEYLFDLIGTTNKFCVEFGSRDLLDLSNTANLRLNHGWKVLGMDGNATGESKKEFITAENIEDLFAKYNVPKEFDYASVDVDGVDLHLWKAIQNYSPRLVSVEYNSNFGPYQSFTLPYDPNTKWDNFSMYYGASLAALNKLAIEKGYTLVHVVPCLDAFFVRNDLIEKDWKVLSIEQLHPKAIPCHNPDPQNRKWIEY